MRSVWANDIGHVYFNMQLPIRRDNRTKYRTSIILNVFHWFLFAFLFVVSFVDGVSDGPNKMQDNVSV